MNNLPENEGRLTLFLKRAHARPATEIETPVYHRAEGFVGTITVDVGKLTIGTWVEFPDARLPKISIDGPSPVAIPHDACIYRMQVGTYRSKVHGDQIMLICDFDAATRAKIQGYKELSW